MTRLVSMALAAALVLTGCAGTSGVEVSHDWTGIGAYVVADVNHLATVVGVDPANGRARSLIVIPDRADDDTVSGPVVARNRTSTLIVRPGRSGASTVYRVTPGDPAITVAGHLVDGARLYPRAGGWAEVVPAGRGSTVRLLDERLQLQGSIAALVRPDEVTADGADHLCVAQNDFSGARLVVVDLTKAEVGSPVRLSQQVSVLGCAAGRAVVGTSRGEQAVADPTFTISGGQVRTLEVSAGRFDRLVTDGDTGYALVDFADGIRIFRVSLSSGEVLRTTKVGSIGAVDDLAFTGGRLVITGDDRGASYDVASGAVRTFELPGDVYPS